MSTLYIVATPIGNLGDISSRALRVLAEVDFILCEDTRVTKKLLNHFNITTPVLSYHQHSKIKKVEKILDLLKQNKDLALVSDAGTPGISDPGNKLVDLVVKKLGNKTEIAPIPGPSALTAIASVSGFPMDKFLFLGFPPQKKKRKKFFEKITTSSYSAVLYESPYRIIKTLEDIKNIAGDREVVIGRELTKKFETIYRGNIEKVIREIKGDKQKGEFTIVVRKL